jgi:hypothetical protein
MQRVSSKQRVAAFTLVVACIGPAFSRRRLEHRRRRINTPQSLEPADEITSAAAATKPKQDPRKTSPDDEALLLDELRAA